MEALISSPLHIKIETAVKIIVIIRSWALRFGERNSWASIRRIILTGYLLLCKMSG